jgi:Taurine catabolism dioxygenase TauD, TfdA family
VHAGTSAILTGLSRDGYYLTSVAVSGDGAARFVLELGRSLGELYVPRDCDPREPVIRTAPNRARRAAPFDRAESIGWHGDFATYENRPELSLVLITRADPAGGSCGAWRLASVAEVLASLRENEGGRNSFGLLSQQFVPYSYADREAPYWFRVIETRPDGRLGLRFYLPSIRRGCVAEYGEVPQRIAAALEAVERAADDVGKIVPTQTGSLLVTNNWLSLHDRVRQTISRSRPNREAILCFVRTH